ncbi:hypothetical protein LUZ60_012084 [Juncus effusus]|nr:hypothetical protein LUZ60_012084 [Juncus effusus]
MPRWAVVYLLLAAVFLFLLSISRAPHSPRHRRSRRLFHLGFDPVINQLERQAEQKGLFDPKSFQEELDKFSANQDLSKFDGEMGILDGVFGESGRLNVTERLMELFPLLDTNPNDGLISFTELETWMHKQAHERLEFETEREIDRHDKDGDGEITLHEYLNYPPNQEIDWSNMERERPGWWREKFRIADADGNGSLNSTEFNHFLHPEDSGNPKLLLWLLNERIRQLNL